MILATPEISFSFSSRENVWHQHLYCAGTLKANQVSFKETGEAVRTKHRMSRRCECFDLHKELVPYKQAWSWQRSIVGKRHTLVDRDDDYSDTLIVLQHPPVYTLGTGSQEKYLNFDIQNAPYDLHRTERGGEVTYHGPGQLVMYPILNLRYYKMDLHWYLRSLEEVVIRVLQSTFSIKASRLEGLTGVWVGNRKVAAIGIRVSRWIAYHGLALNVTTDLTPFNHIVPCGIQDRGVGSLSGLLGGPPYGMTDADLIDATYESLLNEFSEIFQLSLEHGLVSDLQVPVENSLSMFAEK